MVKYMFKSYLSEKSKFYVFMKTLPHSVTILFLLFLQLSLFSQNDGEKKYVKIIVEGLSSHENANDINSFMREKDGVLISRMSYNLKLYFGIYNVSSGLELKDFENWLISLGYKVKCSALVLVAKVL